MNLIYQTTVSMETNILAICLLGENMTIRYPNGLRIATSVHLGDRFRKGPDPVFPCFGRLPLPCFPCCQEVRPDSQGR
jgi:hypothetical protein